MAGAFGYGAETLEASKAMAELSLLPAVRAAAPADMVVAEGTSCRHQIGDLAGREALQAVRVLDRALGSGSDRGAKGRYSRGSCLRETADLYNRSVSITIL